MNFSWISRQFLTRLTKLYIVRCQSTSVQKYVLLFSSFQTHILSGFTYKNTFSSLGERHGFKYTAIKVIFTTIATNLVIWLTNYNSPLPIRVQASLLPSMCHVVPFSARTLKKPFSLTIIPCCKKQIEMWFILLSTTSTRHYSFSKHFFSYRFCMFSDFAKVFERKVWRVQVAHLHNAARALSRCFQLSTNLGKDLFRYLW